MAHSPHHPSHSIDTTRSHSSPRRNTKTFPPIKRDGERELRVVSHPAHPSHTYTFAYTRALDALAGGNRATEEIRRFSHSNLCSRSRTRDVKKTFCRRLIFYRLRAEASQYLHTYTRAMLLLMLPRVRCGSRDLAPRAAF